MVDKANAPTMAALRDEGVDFQTAIRCSRPSPCRTPRRWRPAIILGDTGDFSNTIYTGFPVPGAAGSVTPFLENDPVLGDVDEHFAGNFLDETTVLAAARAAGLQHRRDRQARARA